MDSLDNYQPEPEPAPQFIVEFVTWPTNDPAGITAKALYMAHLLPEQWKSAQILPAGTDRYEVKLELV